MMPLVNPFIYKGLYMFERDQAYPAQLTSATTTSFLPKVYGWMTIGLALTALASVFTLSSEAALQLIFA